MTPFQKHILKSLAFKAVTLCLVSVALFFADIPLFGRDVAFRQVPFLVMSATFFFAMSLAGSMLYKLVMARGGKMAVGYYLLTKVARLLATIVLMLVYALAVGRDLLPFTVGLLVLYLASMVTSIMFYVKGEQILNKKQ